MTSELRIVLDTGVAISAALLPGSIPRQAVDIVLSRGRLLISEATTLELDDVFRRPKFDKYIRQESRLEFLAALVRDAELVEIKETIKVCRDPKDDKFFELAISGKALHLILTPFPTHLSPPFHKRQVEFFQFSLPVKKNWQIMLDWLPEQKRQPHTRESLNDCSM